MIVGVIQVRMGSTRLAGKALADLYGQPLLLRLYERVNAAKTLDKIVIATGSGKENRPIVDFAALHGIRCVVGSETDLVERYLRVVRDTGATAMLRVTGDCPLADPALIDEMVYYYKAEANRFDYVTNALRPTHPDGLDLDIFSTAVLNRIDGTVQDAFWREWFTSYLRENAALFRVHNIENATDLSNLRWTVDYEEDLVFVNAVFSHLYPAKPIFGMQDILELLVREPQLKDINHKHTRDAAYHAAKKEQGK